MMNDQGTDIHLLILIGIMLLTGAFGGFLNYLNDFDTVANEQKDKKTRFKYVLLGIGAAFLIPLFLKMLESDILSRSGNLNYLIFGGFCLIAAIFSRRFISSIGDRILEAAKNAEKAALESKAKSESTHRDLLTTKERIEDVKLAVDLESTTTKTMGAEAEKIMKGEAGSSKPLLMALAESYLEKTSVPDYGQRLKLKAEMGRKMGEIILRNRMSKEELLKSHTSEGMRLAIAYAVQLRPEQGDLAILHQLAVEAEQLYTRYSILIGYDTLVRNSMISREQLQETLQRVKSFRHKADPSLLVKVEESENLLNMLADSR